MSEIKHITDFFGQAQADKRLGRVHLSLCMALSTYWQANHCRMPFRVTRKRLMELARIYSTATYHKCIKEMVAFGYIEYKPNYNYYKGTQVRLLSLN
ncbi:hypothetical protein BEL04_00220 [Mucilaginibacter sp. PPCGB 2223]|uniref:hypothetical protein n=1 Tax=Mucilaginibacter sp. PPCGB 2223 TaxID=1886027 RepID=UPI0008258A6C|nr:hypothetical protein [Mucilaginibacter sp. PPCGB 2223]OCX52796.1 hypothetical protein BEL04_00220 [Mucilaginibacter sp. PPCGB 2223]